MLLQTALGHLCIKHQVSADDAVVAALDLVEHHQDSDLGREMNQLVKDYTGHEMDGATAASILDMDDELLHTER
jgi:CheY-like chemotaxis protein